MSQSCLNQLELIKLVEIWIEIILPPSGSVLVMYTIFHFERFSYDAAREKRRKWKLSHTYQYICLNFIKFKSGFNVVSRQDDI